MRKLKAGIVGCGGIANGKHLPAIKKSGLYEIVAFCDIVRERAEKAKEEYGTEDAKVFEDYKVLIKEDLDVVYVTTPTAPMQKSLSQPWKQEKMLCVKSQWQRIMLRHRKWWRLQRKQVES